MFATYYYILELKIIRKIKKLVLKIDDEWSCAMTMRLFIILINKCIFADNKIKSHRTK